MLVDQSLYNYVNESKRTFKLKTSIQLIKI